MLELFLPRNSEEWGISEKTVQKHVRKTAYPGVAKIQCLWLIPKDAEKPNKPVESRRKKKTCELSFNY